MKRKDLALILVIVVISASISFLISKKIFNSPTKRQQKAEIVQVISSDLTLPDKQFFNENSVNPTKLITIGQSPNTEPFTKTQR